MQHDVNILEQVFYQTFFSNMHKFSSFVSSLHLLSPKTLAKDPLDSDQHEEMHSASETESEGGSDSEAVVNDAPSTNEGTVVSTHTQHNKFPKTQVEERSAQHINFGCAS